jgi:hypothetical protein
MPLFDKPKCFNLYNLDYSFWKVHFSYFDADIE